MKNKQKIKAGYDLSGKLNKFLIAQFKAWKPRLVV
jgi:hypothetical protein